VRLRKNGARFRRKPYQKGADRDDHQLDEAD
jgi:hypothetical protein